MSGNGERETNIRDQARRLGVVWPSLRGERLAEYEGALVRDERLEARDVRSGVDRLVAEFGDTTYPPNPGDVVGMAHLARQERRREEGEVAPPVGPWTVAQAGQGCPECRHAGWQPLERIREGVWRDGGGIVHCTEHDMGWQGRLAAERDPGPGGYVTAQQMRELMERMSETNARYRVVWARLVAREKRGEEIDWRRYAGAGAIGVEQAEMEVLDAVTAQVREAVRA